MKMKEDGGSPGPVYDVKYAALLNHTQSAIISGWKEMKIEDTPGP